MLMLYRVQIVDKHDLKTKGFEHLRRLLLFIWFSSSTLAPEEKSDADLMLEFACTFWTGHELPTGQILGVTDEEVLGFFGRDVVPVYGPGPFLSRLHSTLEGITTDGRASKHLTTIYREISRGLLHPAFRPHLETSGVLDLVMHGFKNILDDSLQDTSDMSTHVALFAMVLPFIKFVLRTSAFLWVRKSADIFRSGLSQVVGVDEIVTKLLCDYDAMFWISAGLLSSARTNTMNTSAYTSSSCQPTHRPPRCSQCYGYHPHVSS